jgi:hypothetical protein
VPSGWAGTTSLRRNGLPRPRRILLERESQPMDHAHGAGGCIIWLIRPDTVERKDRGVGPNENVTGIRHVSTWAGRGSRHHQACHRLGTTVPLSYKSKNGQLDTARTMTSKGAISTRSHDASPNEIDQKLREEKKNHGWHCRKQRPQMKDCSEISGGSKEA